MQTDLPKSGCEGEVDMDVTVRYLLKSLMIDARLGL